MRLNLARALMCRSDLLLLDEPTNHLDLDAVLWLEQWLRDYAGTLLLISHDRDFLDNCAEFIASIEDGTVRLYAGNYAQFERQQAERIARETALAIKQQREVAHVRAFVDRFRAKATKARQVQSRLKALARLETVAASRTDSPFHFTFADPGGSSNPLLEIEEGCFGYGDTTVLEGVRVSLAPGDRVGLLGRNGAGKSTLIRAIAGVMQPKHGRRRPARGLRVGYFAQHQLEQLDPGADALVHLRRLAPQEREQTLREFLGGFGLSGEDALRPLTTFSGGERARLALALLVWRRPHLLLLDEPTNHLDLRMRDALTLALQDYPGAMVLVSHDRHLLRATSDRLLLVDNSAVNAFDGDLDDYRTWLLRGTSEVREHAGRDPVRQSRREQRRRDAEARTQRRPLLDRLRRAEKLLAELDTKRQAIQQVLADSGIYDAGRKRELQDTLLEQGALGQQIERAEEDWLQLSEALETLDRAARGNTGD
jgi:ATP-binding cassette subfamily F protein 3